MRSYRVVRWVDGPYLRWCVVSVSLRGDETWDVMQVFVTREEARAWVGEVTMRQVALETEGLP